MRAFPATHYQSLFVCGLTLILGAGSVPATEVTQYARELEFPASDREELVAVPLDSDVYADTRDNFSDVRLLDGNGAEVPYVLRKSVALRSRTTQEFRPVQNPQARPLDDGGLEITFHLDPERHRLRPDGLRLVTPLRDFEHRIRVFTSKDGMDWEPVIEEGLLFDYTRFMDVRNVSVELPRDEDATNDFHRHFRIVIDDVTQEQQSQLMQLTRQIAGEEEIGRSESTVIQRQPFRIDRIHVWSDVKQSEVESEQETEYSLTNLKVEQDKEHQRTVVYVDSMREPLTKLKLQTPTRNFGRTVRVEGFDQRRLTDMWRPLSSNVLSRIDFQDLQQEQLDIQVPPSRYSQYRLAIQNRDSPPLEVTGVEARGLVYEVVFLAVPQTAYQLVYGNSRLEAPQYDTVALKAALKKGFQPISATLGEPSLIEAVAVAEEPLALRLLKDSRAILLLIGVLVLLLAWGLYTASRRLDAVEK